MSLIAVGSIGAPILAIGGIETGAISYLITGAKMTTSSRFAIGGVDAAYQLANTSKVNWIQSVGAQLGPLTYALTSNTTFEYSTFTFGINPDATVQNTIIATAFNIAGTEMLRVSDGVGVGSAAGTVSSIPGIIGDQINNGIK